MPSGSHPLIRSSYRCSGQCKGNSIAEMPLLILMALVVIGIPFIGMSTLALRAAFMYSNVKSACAIASRSTSFNEAKSKAESSLSSGCAAFNGVKLEDCQISIITKVMATGSERESFTTIPPESLDTEHNLYLIRVKASAAISPLVQISTAFCGGNVPGLTEPYMLTVRSEAFAERPKGLSF